MSIERISIEIKSNAKDIEKELRGIDARIEKLKNSRAEIKVNADALAEAKRKIQEIDVHLKQLAAAKASIKADVSQMETVKKRISEIDSQIKKLNAEKAKISVDASNSEAAKSRLQEISAQMKALRSEKAALQVETKQLSNAQNALEDIEQQMKELKAQKALLQVDTTQLKGADKEINNLEKELSSLNKQKARLQIQREDAAEAQGALGKLKAKLSEIGSTKTNINISSNIAQIGTSLDNMGSKILSMINPLKSMLSQWVGIGAAVKLVNSAINLVTGSIGGAISRYDTMNNFPRVMANLGIETKAADAALETLDDGLQGLPTALDDAVTSVQRFASINGDVEKSADAFLAVNNAILAGGANATVQASALEQLSQAYSKGKFDMMEWRSLLTAMPAQLQQIASAFGMTTDGLYTAIQKGNISMDDFMDKVIELNEEGVDGFASFADQAIAATGGVSTAIANMGNAVKRGWAKVMEAFDNVLVNTEFGSIAGIFNSIRDLFNKGFSKIVEIIDNNQDKILAFFERVRSFNWAGVWNGLKEGVSSLKTALKNLLKFLSPVIDLVKNLITNLGGGDFATGLGKLPSLLFKIGIGAKVIGTVIKGVSKISGSSGILGLIFGKKSGTGATSMASAGSILTSSLKSILNIGTAIGTVYLIAKIIPTIVEALKAINDGVSMDTSGIVLKMVNIAIALGAMGLLVAAASKLVKMLGTSNTIKGMAMIAALCLEIMLAAEAIDQMNRKVPSDILAVAGKLLNMAIVLAGMGVLVAAAGFLATKAPTIAIAGLIAVAALSLELMLVAEALRQMDEKVPDSIETVASKLAGIAIAIGGMAVIAGVIGAVMATGIGAVIVGAGLLAIAAIAGDLMLVAEAIHQLDEKVPENFGAVEDKITTIAEVITAFTQAGFGSIFDLFSNLIGALNIAAVSGGVLKMVDLGAALQKFDTVDIPKGIEKKIKAMKKVVEAIGSDDGLFDNLRSFLANMVENAEMVTAVSAIKIMTDLGKELMIFNAVSTGLDVEGSKTNIKNMKSVLDAIGSDKGLLDSLNSFITNIVQNADIKNAINAIKRMTDMSKELMIFNAIAALIDTDTANTNIENMKSVIDTIGSDKGLLESLKGFVTNIVQNADIGTAIKAIERMTELSTGLVGFNEAANAVKYFVAIVNVGKIKQIIDAIGSDDGLFDSIHDFLTNIVDTANIQTAIKAIGLMTELSAELMSFNADVAALDMDATSRNIENLQGIIEHLGSDEGLLSNTASFLTNMVSVADDSTAYMAAVIMKRIATELREFNKAAASVDSSLTKGRIEKVKGIIEYLGSDEGLLSNTWSLLTNMASNANESTALASIQTLNAIVAELKIFQETVAGLNFGGFFDDIFGYLSGDSSGGLKGKIASIKEVIEALGTSGEGLFSRTGTTFSGWDAEKSGQPIIEALTTLNSMVEQMGTFSASVTNLDFDTMKEQIEKVREGMKLLSGENGFWGKLGEAFAGFAGNEISEEALAELELLVEIVEILNDFPAVTFDYDTISTAIKDVQKLLGELKGFAEYTESDSITTIIEAFKGLVETLNNMASEYTLIGESYGKKLIQGFLDAKVPDKIKLDIEATLEALGTLADRFYDMGNTYGAKVIDGFKAGISNADGKSKMASLIATQILALSGKTRQFTSIGRSYGNALVNAFSGAVSNMSFNVNGASTGGYIGSDGTLYRAKGGIAGMFRPKGTDTIPAMLTPGEFVHNRSAVNAFGLDFMRKVNNADILGTFKAMTSRFGPQRFGDTLSVINNFNNNSVSTNNAKVTIQAHGGNPDYMFKRANRYVKVRA